MIAPAEQKIFIVEGNIGAGKSTFLRVIQEYLAAQMVFEPHEMWQNVAGENLLDYFYKDTTRWAYTFQTYAFVTRVVTQERMARRNPFGMQILERSVYSDRYCFAKNAYELGVMNDLEWKLYQEWFEWLVTQYTPKPHGFIYLQTDPEICYERLLKRNRSEENGVSFDYLKLLHDKHESWLLEKNDIASYLKDVPVLVLSCNEEFENDVAMQQYHIRRIAEFLDSHFAIPQHVSIKQNILL